MNFSRTFVCAAMALFCAPATALAQSNSWTGFYAGGNIGYGWGNADTDFSANGSNIAFPDFLPVHTTNLLGLTSGHRQNLSGVAGGGQLGFNYQFQTNWLLGLEADLQGSNLSGSHASAHAIDGLGCTGVVAGPPIACGSLQPFTGNATIETHTKIDWFGTLRARVGLISQDHTLIYATGGLAYGRGSISGTFSGSATQSFSVAAFAGNNSFTSSKLQTGFAVGGGIEGRFAAWVPSNWTWKAEYLYVDLGSVDVTSPIMLASSAPSVYTDVTGEMRTKIRLTDNIVRVGINYHFRP